MGKNTYQSSLIHKTRTKACQNSEHLVATPGFRHVVVQQAILAMVARDLWYRRVAGKGIRRRLGRPERFGMDWTKERWLERSGRPPVEEQRWLERLGAWVVQGRWMAGRFQVWPGRVEKPWHLEVQGLEGWEGRPHGAAASVGGQKWEAPTWIDQSISTTCWSSHGVGGCPGRGGGAAGWEVGIHSRVARTQSPKFQGGCGAHDLCPRALDEIDSKLQGPRGSQQCDAGQGCLAWDVDVAKLWIQDVAPQQARPSELQQVRCSGPGWFEADLDQDRTEAHAGVDRRRFLGKAGQEAEVLCGQSGLLRRAVTETRMFTNVHDV